MTSPSAERFNRTADGYLRWWAPVLAPASVALVDLAGDADPGLPGGAARDVVDVGCGTGSSLFEAARRWPGAKLAGLDASVGMLAVARREAERLPAAVSSRIGYVESDASTLPLPGESVDLVMTAFMLQQVPSRSAVLAEFRRILRPGGLLALAGWLVEAKPFAPDVELEAALADAGVVRAIRNEVKSGHFASTAAAADELREAGFRGVIANEGTLEYAWSRAGYATYRATTRDFDLFDSLEPGTRSRALAAIARRLDALSDDQLVFRPPIVTLLARRG